MTLKAIKYILILLTSVLFFIGSTGFKAKIKEDISKNISPFLNPIPKDFILSILNFGYDPSRENIWITNHLTAIKDSLKFNVVHSYSSESNKYGRFSESLSDVQIDNVKVLMNEVNLAGLRGMFDVIKLEILCYGQSIEYEISSNGNKTENNGFCYQEINSNVSDYIQNDNGRTARHSAAERHSAGWLCKNIFENIQHSDLFDYQWSDTVSWKIKPMMRINPVEIANNPSLEVAAIVTKNFIGKTIDSVVLKARNFAVKNNQGNYVYNGEYINKYNFSEEPVDNVNNLVVSGDKIKEALNEGWTGQFSTRDSKVDFGIYWFGKVDVWFDKMVVEDETAEQLFSGIHDDKIREVINNFTGYPGNYNFFVDEMTYSNYRCMKYVYDKAMNYNPDTRLSFALTNYFNYIGMRDNNLLTYRILLDSIKPKIFTCDAHEIDPSRCIPNVFGGQLASEVPDSWKKTPAEYTEYFQENSLGDRTTEGNYENNPSKNNFSDGVNFMPSPWGSFIFQLTRARDISNQVSSGSRMIIQPQIHGNLVRNDLTGKYVGFNREPFNEEIGVQAMVSIAHGVDGISWFIYNSYSYEYPKGFTNYTYGFLQPNSEQHRYYNIYGQNKWQYVKEMNQKIQNWKPTLDKIIWTAGSSVHTDGVSQKYISDIKSIYKSASSPYDYKENNLDRIKYWEMGFFIPDPTHPRYLLNDKSKYFIVVNRRCIPNTSEYIGDYRQLKIKFDFSELQEYNNWKVIDVNTNEVVTLVNKNDGLFYSLGEFNPGEGKLFKLEPVL